MSYARFDDTHDDGELTEFRKRLAAEVRAQTGREFVIFQDRANVAWGQNWQQRIDEALDVATLLLVIITPGFFSSAACRAELARFLERERALGRSDLILPVYYISATEMNDPAARESDELARVLASRQYADWRDLRFEPLTSPKDARPSRGWRPDAGHVLAPGLWRGSSRCQARAASDGSGRAAQGGWRVGTGGEPPARTP